MQAGEGTRNWHVLSVARVLFFDLEMIEHLFAINLIEALHCRGGINKHTDMNSKMKEVGAGKSPGRRRKTISPHIQVVPGAGNSPGRRRKNDQYR